MHESADGGAFHRGRQHWPALASNLFGLPFERAALLSIDGFGDFVSTMWGRGCGHKLEIDGWVEFPHSMGLLYTAITQYLGFSKYGDEFKVMGLAPYGQPEYLDGLRKLVARRADGSFALDLSHFVHHSDGVNMTWGTRRPSAIAVFSPKLEQTFGRKRLPARGSARH